MNVRLLTRACATVIATMATVLVVGTGSASAASAPVQTCHRETYPQHPAQTGNYCSAPLSMYPNYRGWDVSIDFPSSAPCGSVEHRFCGGALMSTSVWSWSGTAWKRAEVASGGSGYVYPYAQNWRWFYVSGNAVRPGAWYAVELDRLYVNWFVRG